MPSQEQAVLIAESIPHLVWVADPGGALRYVNRRWQQYTGLPVEEVGTWDWRRLIHPEDLPPLRDEWQKAHQAGEYRAEYRLRRADGAYRWHRVRGLPLRDERGHIAHWVGTCTDIEEERWAVEALRHSERRFRALVENSWDGITLLSAAGAVLERLPAKLKDLGYSRDEFVGHNGFEFMHPDDLPAMRRALGEVLQAPGGQVTARYRLRHKDGSWRWFEATGTNLLHDPDVRALVVNHKDITERLLAEDERGRLLARHQMYIERLPLAHILLGADLRIADWNPAAERVFGFSREEALGRDPLELIVAPPARAGVKGVFLRNRERDMAAHSVNDNVTKDGRVITCEWFNTPLLDADGNFVGLLGLAQDITERRRLEEQFLQAQKMEAVGRLAGGIAHDFNNLLTVINGYADMLLQDLAEGAPCAPAVRAILDAGTRAAALTQQLLAFGRKQMAAPRLLDLSAVVRDMGRMLRRLIGEHILLEEDLQPGSVRADPTQLQQVVLNLVVNARDAMPRGGQLSLVTREAERAEGGRWVVLEVSDTGCGMSEDVKAHLFEPFFTTKAIGQGTGLGLSTVHGIVKQNGGHIEVESQPGQGTAFRIYLPRAEGPADPGSPTGAPAARRGHETVLLAEDEAAVRSLVRQVLQSAGYAVLEAGDGAQALGLAGRHPGPIDLLVTDVTMPGLDGRGLAERLRAARPGLKVLYLSGYTDDAVVRHGVWEEADHFLPKPFSVAALAQKVQEVLGSRTRGKPTPPTPA